MINFCPPGAPITARRVPENVLRSLGVQQVRAGRFSYSHRHGAPRPYPRANWSVVQTGLRAGGWKTGHVPRRTWLDSKIDVFLEELAASGMHLDRQRAGELITGQVCAVATLMSVTEATARRYLGDEIITDMARRMLFEVAGERPGADLLEAPRTVPLPLALVGITVAALAEAMQVRAANEPPGHLGDVITTYAQTLSGFGQITADAAGDPAGILFPPALLRRAARYISGAADLAANGGKLPAGVPETARSQLAATLRRDADGLTALTAVIGDNTLESPLLGAPFPQDGRRVTRGNAPLPLIEQGRPAVLAPLGLWAWRPSPAGN